MIGELIVIRDKYKMFKDDVATYIAAALPRRVVYFAAIRLWAYATKGKYSYDNSIEIPASEAIKRYGLLVEGKDKFEEVRVLKGLKIDGVNLGEHGNIGVVGRVTRETYETRVKLSFKDARRVMREEFQKDSEEGGLRHSYQSNIAMLIDDDLHVGHEKRNELADRIIKLIFES